MLRVWSLFVVLTLLTFSFYLCGSCVCVLPFVVHALLSVMLFVLCVVTLLCLFSLSFITCYVCFFFFFVFGFWCVCFCVL